MSKNDELCIKNEELCIKNEELCIKNDAFCREPRPPTLFSEMKPDPIGSRAPLLAEHTVEVLTEAGMSGAEISKLLDEGAVAQPREPSKL